MHSEVDLTRAERRRRKRDIYPCMGGCGRRRKLKHMENGYCKKCAAKFRALAQENKLPPPVSAHIGGWTR